MTKQEILAIRQTLQRIESGQYGTCAKCGKPIDGLRLELLPYTATCVQCA
jgi:RNA polymerase-binding transcription factor DksA